MAFDTPLNFIFLENVTGVQWHLIHLLTLFFLENVLLTIFASVRLMSYCIPMIVAL